MTFRKKSEKYSFSSSNNRLRDEPSNREGRCSYVNIPDAAPIAPSFTGASLHPPAARATAEMVGKGDQEIPNGKEKMEEEIIKVENTVNEEAVGEKNEGAVEEKVLLNEEQVEIREKPKQRRHEPPDGGWGWLVLVSAFIVMTLVSTVGPCFSIMFQRPLLELGTPTATIAWIFNTFSLTWNITGLLVGPLVAEFGHRPIAFIGGIVAAVAIGVSSFTTSAWFLFLIFSLVGGIGCSMVVTASVLIVPTYFRLRLGRANGILMAGTSVGQFTAPLLINYLQDEYTFKGATWILGAIVLNSCVAASTFQPFQWHSKLTRDQRRDTKTNYRLTAMLAKAYQPWKPGGQNVAATLFLGAVFFNTDNTSTSPAQLVRYTARTSSELNYERAKRRGARVATVNESQGNEGEASATVKSRYGNFLLFRVARSTLQNLKILKIPRALILAIISTFVIIGYLNFIMMVPFVVNSVGGTPDVSAWCISVAGGCSLVSRVIVSALADYAWFNMKIGFFSGISIIATSTLAFTFFTSQTILTVIMGVWGCGIGIYMGLYNLVMIKCMGVENLPAMFGAASFLNGLGFITLGPLLGTIRDLTGSFPLTIRILSATEMLCMVLWLIMPTDSSSRFCQTQEKKEKSPG